MSLFSRALGTCRTQLLLDSLYNGILVCGRVFLSYLLDHVALICLQHTKLSAYMSLFMDVTVYEACLLDWLWGRDRKESSQQV